MAQNLRAKIPASDLMLIADRETGATDRFVEQVGNTGGLEVCSSVKEVAERSVSVALGPFSSSILWGNEQAWKRDQYAAGAAVWIWVQLHDENRFQSQMI